MDDTILLSRKRSLKTIIDQTTTSSNRVVMKIFPNPAKSEVEIRYQVADEIPLPEQFEVAIYNMQGVLLQSKKVTGRAEQLKFYVDRLIAGNYLVVLTGNGERYTEQILIKK